MTTPDVTDEMLTAFLDGEADQKTSSIVAKALEEDPKISARLEALQIPMQALRDGFDLAATATPIAKLTASIDADKTEPTRLIDQGREIRRPAKLIWLAAAAVVLSLGLGMVLGRILPAVDGEKDWRGAVAEYQVLYTTETLQLVDRDAAANRKDVERIAGKISANVSFEALDRLDGLTFKRAQVLSWQGNPLAQFAFLRQDGEPIAFCVTATDEADRAIELAELEGLASASWVEEGIGFMVIGGQDMAFIETTTAQLIALL